MHFPRFLTVMNKIQNRKPPENRGEHLKSFMKNQCSENYTLLKGVSEVFPYLLHFFRPLCVKFGTGDTTICCIIVSFVKICTKETILLLGVYMNFYQYFTHFSDLSQIRHTMLLRCMKSVKRGAGNTAFFLRNKQNYIYSSIVNAYDILKVKNTVVKPV